MISIDNGYFHLITENTSYVIRILSDKTVNHCYYGKRLTSVDLDDHHLFIEHDYTAPVFVNGGITTIDAVPQECPSCGRGDYRYPAVVIAGHDGREINEFKYVHYRHFSGIPEITGLPHLDSNIESAETLELVMRDSITRANIYLYYTVFEECDIIARHIRIENDTEDNIVVCKVMSASFDLECTEFDMITLEGRWANERNVERVPLRHGKNIISSSRGSTGHHTSPFVALAQQNADEQYGDVYAMSLVYSGSFEMGAEVGQFGSTRFFAGINSETFSWCLKEKESFVSPQVLLTYSEKGFGGMSHNFHRACRNHLGACANVKKHPIVLNLWEAFYFDVCEEKVIESIRAVKDLGVDTVVLDDGWFGKRKNDKSSLGDWYINEEKFPNGLEKIIKECKENDLKFGLWFEPEMISEDSNLFRNHSDWHIRIEGTEPMRSRNELVLDYARPEVVEEIYKVVSRILKNNAISYVKWDMNRNITDYGSSILERENQAAHHHKYILGVYSLMKRITQKFPNVFFEGSAGGGGRFDFGILYYMPQIWTSDNSDAISRLNIQYGTSMVFPPETMSAHVSACPNHQTGRVTPIKTRANVAQFFSYGYEFDPCDISEEERRHIITQIAWHKRLDEWLANARFYRLVDPKSNNFCAWQIVSDDQKHSALLYAIQLAEANFNGRYIHLKGLDPKKQYRILQQNVQLSGDILMKAGIPIRKKLSDFESLLIEIEEAVKLYEIPFNMEGG